MAWTDDLAGRLKDRVKGWWRTLTGAERTGAGPGLKYFDQILPIELREINLRRKERVRIWGGEDYDDPVKLKISPEDYERGREGGYAYRIGDDDRWDDARPRARTRFPRPRDLQKALNPSVGTDGVVESPLDRDPVDPVDPEMDRMRPQPVPCSAKGLALSGGGIRSAAVCLGALQALNARDRFGAFDYMSTVSGGGYVGSCLSASMARSPEFPFGSDISDAESVAHLRNFSNYLLPRGRSSIRNFGEAAAVLLRGLVANTIVVATFVIALALTTRAAWPGSGHSASLLISLFDMASTFVGNTLRVTNKLLLADSAHILPPLVAALIIVLVVWAAVRSIAPNATLSNDTSGIYLWMARMLIVGTLVAGFVEIQPVLIRWAQVHILSPESSLGLDVRLTTLTAFLAAFAGAVSACSTALGHFLKKTERSNRKSVLTGRLLAKVAILAAASILPLLIWGSYVILSAWLVAGLGPGDEKLSPATLAKWCAIGGALSVCFAPNAYSLHRFYRDRLVAAFLLTLESRRSILGGLLDRHAPDKLKLSELKNGVGPYHILNAALNVQGSREANKRGRDADFFTFTPDFVGSDLTFFAPLEGKRSLLGFVPTLSIESIDPALDVGTAMAISGAAVSANMGGNTIRSLSPTLALLNIRLGYWLRNPRFIAAHGAFRRGLQRILQLGTSKLYLFKEMLNLQDETSPSVYLTDGGHIENLGVYELLKRGCETIVVIDAEADPELAFPSLLKVERFARIDLGVRIDLPWEAIARETWHSQGGNGRTTRPQGVHCAVGKIRYADGVDGILIYFKSSLTGDERDYVLDYKRRNPSFPHETTGDQFFSEEQFEMYRALGFHMVDGFFSGDMPFAFHGDFGSASNAYQAVCDSLKSLHVPAYA